MIIKSSDLETTLGSPSSTQTTRVLHLINGEHFAGAERVQDLLAMALPQFGYEAGFACVKADKFPKVRRSSSPLYELNMKNKFDLLCYRNIAKIICDENYKLIHAHTPRSLLIGSLAARATDCPLIYHVHSPAGRDSERGLKNWINTKVETWALSRVDRMICVSNSLMGYMESLGHPAVKLNVVSNGVAAIDDLPHRDAPGKNDVWTLGTMALFRPRKGVEVLLEALSILKNRGVKTHLRAVGQFETSEYESEVMNLVNRLGIADMITWTGFQTNVNEQIRKMDLFVLPSLYGEGLPMVVLESMANAVPVVASNVEGIPEAVRDNVDGLIFKPGDAKDLAAKVESMVGDSERWNSMSQSAYVRQRTCLSDISMAEGTSEVYSSLLN
ncbi:glycosyltransferase [Mariniblastus fucicola]|uniref:Glycosyltransferase EpsD n=1 Tax=Mariniblastus fucicola TaxID=980251 RepID=A0A5B9PB28_9BACT|nr:glycosyltransferase [Mariniblastus fucicola]QEG23494.1 Putative glycosyltransferase EpsD [Mariniblastus fucicola]